MNIAVGSAWRDRAANVMPYLNRVAALRDAREHHGVRVVAVEGDSVDNTRQTLEVGARCLNLALDLRTCNHGQPWFGSVESEARFKAMSRVGNEIFEGVKVQDDVLVYIESDLHWDAATIWRLIDQVCRWQVTGYDVIAPMIFAGKAFYDIWAFRGLDGVRWEPFRPYHKDADGDHQNGHNLVEVSAVGSCLVMRGEVARNIRIKNDFCLVGWCQEARQQGYRVAVDMDAAVVHP